MYDIEIKFNMDDILKEQEQKNFFITLMSHSRIFDFSVFYTGSSVH